MLNKEIGSKMEETVGISDQGLSNILIKLQEEGLIERKLDKRYRANPTTPQFLFRSKVSEFIQSPSTRMEVISSVGPICLLSRGLDAYKRDVTSLDEDLLGYAVDQITHLFQSKWRKYMLSRLQSEIREKIESYGSDLREYVLSHNSGKVIPSYSIFGQITQDELNPVWSIIDNLSEADIYLEGLGRTSRRKSKKQQQIRRRLLHKTRRKLFEDFERSLSDPPEGFLLMPLGQMGSQFWESVVLNEGLNPGSTVGRSREQRNSKDVWKEWTKGSP